jgi:hypothetical protein
MKTTSTIKTTSALFSAALLLSLSGQAAQNLNTSAEFTTPSYSTRAYGAKSTFNVFDDYTLPSGTTAYTYSVTARGTVTGKIPQREFTAADGSVSVKVTNNNQASLNANLKVAGINLIDTRNTRVTSYVSPTFVKSVEAAGSVPFNVPIAGFPVPFTVDAKAKATVIARLRADAVFAPSLLGGLPRVTLTGGPEADLAASAQASLNVGWPGFSVGAGAEGSIAIARSALKAQVILNPTLTFNGIGPARRGLRADVSAFAQLPGVTGRVGVFAKAEGFGQIIQSPTLNIANFAIAAPAPVTFFGPVSYQLF